MRPGPGSPGPVSYTHLDVYKRQEQKELEPVVIAFRELEAARIMQREAEGMLADPPSTSTCCGAAAYGTAAT